MRKKSIITLFLSSVMIISSLFTPLSAIGFSVETDEIEVTDNWSVEAGNLDSWWAGEYPETVGTEYVLDGSLETRWQGYSANGDMSGQYLAVNMGAPESVSGIRAYIPDNFISDAYPLSVNVSVSDNGSDWKDVKSESYTYDDSVKVLDVDFGKNIEIQYIKYAITSKPTATSASCIAELRALAAKNSYDDYTYATLPTFSVAGDEIGITSDWSAEGDINQYFTDRTAALTIDGSDATLWFAPAAQGGATPSMIVDMGEAKSFSGARVYYNIDGNGAGQTNGLRSVTLLASDNGDDWKAIKTVTYATDETVYEIDLGYNIEAQYIKYQINGVNDSGSWWGTPMIKEFRVLSAKEAYTDESLEALPLFDVAEDEISVTGSWSAEGDVNEYFTDRTAELTIDGSDATLWFAPAARDGATPSMIVDMAEVKNISGVRVYYNIDGNGTYTNGLRNVTLLASETGEDDDWTILETVTYDTDETLYEIDLGCNIEAQYIKYQINSVNDSGSWYGTPMIKEFRVLKEKSGYADETLETFPLFDVADDEISPTGKWKISHSGGNEWFPVNAAASLMMDGKIDTYWVGAAVDNGSQYVIIDMGEERIVSGMRNYFKYDSNSYPLSVNVYYSNDADEWQKIRNISYVHDSEKLILDVSFGKNIETRYLKYEIARTTGTGTQNIGAVFCSEMRVIGERDFSEIDYNLTVNYVDGEGSSVADTYSESFVSGTVYNVDSPIVNGYTPDIKTVTGTLLEDAEVTVVYSLNSYEVRYYINSVLTYTDEFKYGETITKRPDEVQDGWIFSGWSEIPEAMPYEDVEVFATLTIDVYYRIVTDKTEAVVAEGVSIRSLAALKLMGDIEPDSRKLSWKSENEEVVKVKDGIITGVSAGDVKVYVYLVEDESICAEIDVTVTEKTDSATILIDGEEAISEEIDISRGEEHEISVSVTPVSANDSYKFTTSNKNIAYVKEGNIILFGKTGTVVITAEATDGSGRTAKVTLNVK